MEQLIKKNDIFTVSITDLDQDGNGIGHIRENGMAVFVKDTVPGDEARIRIVKVKKTLAFGRLEKILIPSPDRTDALCFKARACGGCTLQSMKYEAQLKCKQQKVKNCLTRIGGFEVTEDPTCAGIYLEPITGMEKPWRFRNKMQFPAAYNKEGQPELGFYAGRTHSLVPLEDCPIGHPVNRLVISAVKGWVRDQDIPLYDETTHTGLLRHVLTRVGFTSRELMVCLVINGTAVPAAQSLKDRLESELKKQMEKDRVHLVSLMINLNTERTNRILGSRSQVLSGRSYIEDSIGGLTFRISPQSFYQVNPVQTENIYRKALEYADLSGSETVWDMYCGTGTISLFLSQKAKSVYGVEIVPEAIEDARLNARLNARDNTRFFVGKAEEVVPRWLEEEGSKVPVDVVVVDPPRKGCDARLLETIVRMAPKRMVYVSCDPSTLARDLKYLTENGFHVEKAAAFDAFCHSMHVETVCCLYHQKKDFISVPYEPKM